MVRHFLLDDATVPDASDLLQVAVAVATQASDHVRRRRVELTATGQLSSSAETKSSEVDPVTIVDKESEELIASLLSRVRPGDGIVGEEGADRPSSTGVRWIVDPIDGTVNFLYGIPHYAVSVAAALRDEVLAAAVVNVATGRIYRAALGRGAFAVDGPSGRNPAPVRLKASGQTSLGRSLVATGFSYMPHWRRKQAELLESLLPDVRDIRRMGSAALDLCAVAEGNVDAYYEHGTHPWDYAAGTLIATEAGAHVQHPGLNASGRDGGLTAASAVGVWDEFNAALGSAGAQRPLT